MEINYEDRTRLDTIAQDLKYDSSIEKFDYNSLVEIIPDLTRDDYDLLLKLYPELGFKAYMCSLKFSDMTDIVKCPSPEIYFEMNKFRPRHVAKLKEYFLIAICISNNPIPFHVTTDFSVDGTVGYICIDHVPGTQYEGYNCIIDAEEFENTYTDRSDETSLILAEDLVAGGGIKELGLIVDVPCSHFDIYYFYTLLEDEKIIKISYDDADINFNLCDTPEQRTIYKEQILELTGDHSNSTVKMLVEYKGVGPYVLGG